MRDRFFLMLLPVLLAGCAPRGLVFACTSDAECNGGQLCGDAHTCVPAPPLAGEGEGEGEGEGDGCDASARVAIFPDDDGDGFTGPQQLVCPDAVPAGALTQAQPTPILLVEPAVGVVENGAFDGTGQFFSPGTDDNSQIALSGFTCTGVPHDATGLEIAVVIGVVDGGDPIENPAVTIVIGGAPPQTVTVDDTGTAYFGGLSDKLGLDALADSAFCDPGFTLDVTVKSPGAAGRTLQLFPAVLLFAGPPDCDDSDDSAFTAADLRDDVDGDGFAAGPSTHACIGPVVPNGKGVNDSDCAPDDPDAFPGQRALFARERTGVGGYDFDCDGQEERPILDDDSVCALNGTTCEAQVQEVAPACGAQFTLGACSAQCALTTSSGTQACR